MMSIEATFAALVVLCTRDHVHLANPLAAWEFDPSEDTPLQEGMCYVFRARWDSGSYMVEGARAEATALSLEQRFNPDFRGYHEKARISGVPVRHRWNGHFGSLEKVCRTSEDAVFEHLLSTRGQVLPFARPPGEVLYLPHGCYSISLRKT